MDTRAQLFTSMANEKAARALYTLATGNGDLKDRLFRAWQDHLIMLSGRDLPEPFQECYDAMYEQVTAHGPDNPNEGQIAASIRHMSMEDAEALAKQTFSFAIDVEVATALR